MLEGGARLPGGRHRAEGTLPVGDHGRPIESGQRFADAAAATETKAAAAVQAAQKTAQEEAAAQSSAQPAVLPEVAQLLRTRSRRGRGGHDGPSV